MVKTWAEKEMRNLKRLTVAGIPCPEPHLLKQHVLIMDFLGEDGWCAPRLREVTLTQEELITAYASIVVDMRRMYQECNLVHGALSEYNLLWHKGRAVIIDVSQSVENAHPMANDFLRMDINNINDYFKKRDVQTLSNFGLFQYITSAKLLVATPALEHAEMMVALNSKLTEMLEAQELEDARCLNEEEENEELVANAVFLQSYIPSSLSEINNPQAENEKMKHGGQREKIYEMAVQRMLGSEETNASVGEGVDSTGSSGVARLPNAIEQMKLQSLQDAVDDSEEDEEEDEEGGECSENSDGEEEEEDDDNEESEEEDERDENGKFIHKKKKSSKYRRRLTDKSNEEDRLKQKEAKKEAKKNTKEQAALKRTKKIPKHVKKRATKKEKK